MLSDLTVGDKLSLKGKIFELGKKLNLMEVGKQHQQNLVFKPKVNTYEFPDRPKDFYSSVERAEQIRKQKLEMLKAGIEREEECSFSPAISGKSKKLALKLQSKDNLHSKAFMRLNGKAKEYKEAHDLRMKQFESHDFDGNKMFQPNIALKTPAHIAVIHSPSNNTISADEFLYRDALDREERMRQRLHSAKEEVDCSTNSKKINQKSELLLKRKAESRPPNRELKILEFSEVPGTFFLSNFFFHFDFCFECENRSVKFGACSMCWMSRRWVDWVMMIFKGPWRCWRGRH